MLVSIIIPTYNRSSLLAEAIQSCINQTYRPIECIIVDDGSTDNTKEIVAKIKNANISSFTVKYICQQNAGSQVARNAGTAASTGQYIQYLDSDDLLYPEKIEKQVGFLIENPECDGVWSGWAKGTPEKNELIESVAREDLLTQFLTEHCVHTLSFLFRRSLVEKIGSWDVNVRRNQEIDFQLRGLLAGANFRFQPQIGGLWRIHGGETIGSTTGAKEFLNFHQKWERILTDKRLFNDKMKKNIANIYLWQANVNKKNKALCLELLEEAVRLNPEIPFTQTSRMKFLKKVVGQRTSIKLWKLRSGF